MSRYYEGNLACDMYENIEEFGLDYQDERYEGLNNCVEKYNLEDGYWIMRNNCGGINLSYWAAITGYSVDQVIQLARGKLIWQDPVRYELSGYDKYAGWLPKEQFLMGNRIKKLKKAIRIDEEYGGFEEEIQLLKENLPEEVSGEDIHVNLGSPWVLSSIEGFVSRFIAQLLDLWLPPKVVYDAYRGKWHIESLIEPNGVLNGYTYGTVRMSALKIIEHKLNAKTVKVFDQIPRWNRDGYDSILNQAATLEAQEKSKQIDIRFQDYCHGDKRNEDILQEAFMNQFGYGLCEFDGSHFEFADCSKKIRMHKNQKDAVAHALAVPSVLFADKVGSGKTIEYSCSVHEMIRLGIVSKAVIVVPNTTLDAVYMTYKNLFPMDRLLLVRPKKEFAPSNRKKTIEMMKSDNYNVVFIAYSSFDMLTMSKQYSFQKKDKEVQECMAQISSAATYHQKHSLERYLKRLKEKNKKYKDEFNDTEVGCFDLLGFDMVVVDEFHNYKNISLYHCSDNIVGMHAKGSKKANNMLAKVRFIQENSGRVILATGTPITNSLADLFVLMRYLMPYEMKMCNIYHFNDWIQTFCEEEHSFEVDVDSKNCRFTTRFSKFHNLTELMSMFSEVCHFYQGEDEEIELPTFKGYTNVVVKKSEEQKKYIEELAKRTEKIRAHEVNRKEDNLLKVTVNGRLCALDIRLVNSDALDIEVENKVRVCARNMARMYFEFPNTTQLGFSDISTPKNSFNIYDELKRELIAFGVEEKHVMFIHDADTDAKRMKVEKALNRGDIRILLGSTQKLGTGTNVQERLVAIHHLDIPWRPADMIQREGRIIRQGNRCPEVYIFRYITEASFDAYTYQILENKEKFISQFLAGSLSAIHRDETDCADTVLSYSEIKALAIGNPLIKERVEIANRLERARIKQRQKKKELLNLEEILMRLPDMMAKRRLLISNTAADIAYYEKRKESISKAERKSFGEELIFALKDNIMVDKERVFSTYQGFEVLLPKHMQEGKVYVWLKRKESNKYSVDMDTDKLLGCCQRLDYCLENLPAELERHNMKLEEYIKQQNQARKDIACGNIYDDEVKILADYLKEIDEKFKGGQAV